MLINGRHGTGENIHSNNKTAYNHTNISNKYLKKEMTNLNSRESMSGNLLLPNSNKIHLLRENVRVVVRVRPILSDSESPVSCIGIDDTNKKQLILEDPRHRGLPKKYEFDEIYNVDETTNDIYENEIKNFIAPLLVDCSCINVFAFGSSGTGKTYTMHGDKDECGIVGLTIKELLRNNEKLENPGKFSFSFFEIYCEKVRDLLVCEKLVNNTKGNNQTVSIRTDICGRVRVVGASTVEFNCWDEFNTKYIEALRRRVSGKTAVNSSSSRSHACIQINFIPHVIIANKDRDKQGIVEDDTVENRRRRGSISFHAKPKVSVNTQRTIVNLIDLSGFENNRVTNNTGRRMTESTFINSSLLALSKVINALKKNDGTQMSQSCIPYRESKLTRLLQEYLGGGADPPYSPYCLRCIMLCTISPSVTYFHQTYATLNTPSYGSTALMRKYIGIASSRLIGRDNLGGVDLHEVSKSTKIGVNLNSNLSNSNINGSILKGKVPNLSVLSIAGSKISKSKDLSTNKSLVKVSNSSCNTYSNVESRVAQIIRGNKSKLLAKSGTINQSSSLISNKEVVEVSGSVNSVSTVGLDGNILCGKSTNVTVEDIDSKENKKLPVQSDLCLAVELKLNKICLEDLEAIGTNAPYTKSDGSGPEDEKIHSKENIEADTAKFWKKDDMGESESERQSQEENITHIENKRRRGKVRKTRKGDNDEEKTLESAIVTRRSRKAKVTLLSPSFPATRSATKNK
ncbi:kinesin motor domain-containing protein [Cryptosporidium muris RN66]|uniref:Kinesin motor domain-containing protein n=1 Tax=Cryptosporidium muris (strain RN66) TaxID=441375 RepID=B6ADL7_CRYMR|nr:kinesin motor domain-containing protein [Cryptosporidium muris RN66]EEA06308.1 kinesin motor domain-containing protein [Cryptosporidium muris RN66]|eukprot:XP_002140657.1 kinesin motor domain-containing protein [Cryptosporidium muris RN66]